MRRKVIRDEGTILVQKFSKAELDKSIATLSSARAPEPDFILSEISKMLTPQVTVFRRKIKHQTL